MSEAPFVLGLRALNLGDFCCAVPAWKAVRRAFPEHRTVLAAPAWQQQLLALCPAIDDLTPVEPLASLPATVHHAAIAVNLHGRGPESSRLLAGAVPQRLISYAHPDVAATAGGPAWDDHEHEVERWCRLVRSVGAEPDPTALELERPAVEPPVSGATVLHTGASAAARCWPEGRWVQLARTLVREGHRVVLTGVAAEAERTRRIGQLAGLAPKADLAGRTDLVHLAALVSDARLVISGDTGTAHLASAYGTPSVVLFGPTPPSTWGPPAHGPHRALWTGATGDPHDGEVHSGLLAIDVANVASAAESLMTDRATAR